MNNAEHFCNSHCDSHLASIHSRKDYIDIFNMINTSPIQTNHLSTKSVWFGLKRDNNYYYNHKYLDNSTFDYGIFTDAYPWYINNTQNTADSDCIELAGDHKYNCMNA